MSCTFTTRTRFSRRGGQNSTSPRGTRDTDGAQLPAGLLLRLVLPGRPTPAATALVAGSERPPSDTPATEVPGPERDHGGDPRDPSRHLAHGRPLPRAHTSSIADHLRSTAIPSDRISVKPNGIPDPGRPESAPGTDFLFAARLTREKGLELTARCLVAAPVGALGELRVAGDGPLRSLAETAAQQRTDVEYLGPLPPERMRAAIRAAGCVVVPSTWHDVLPTIALERWPTAGRYWVPGMGGQPYLVGADPGFRGPVRWVDSRPRSGGPCRGTRRGSKGAAESGGPARRRYELCFAPSTLTARLIEIYEEVASSLKIFSASGRRFFAIARGVVAVSQVRLAHRSRGGRRVDRRAHRVPRHRQLGRSRSGAAGDRPGPQRGVSRVLPARYHPWWPGSPAGSSSRRGLSSWTYGKGVWGPLLIGASRVPGVEPPVVPTLDAVWQTDDAAG